MHPLEHCQKWEYRIYFYQMYVWKNIMYDKYNYQLIAYHTIKWIKY